MTGNDKGEVKMNKKFRLKMILDAIMLVLWLVLMDFNLTGLTLHSILGVVILIIIVVHNALNYSWIKNVTKNFFKKKTDTLTRVKYALNLLLLVLMAIVGASGFMLVFGDSDRSLWLNLHSAGSYAGMIVIAVHVGLHGNMILGALGKAFNINSRSRLKQVVLSLVSLAIISSGIYSSAKIGLMGKIVPEDQEGDTEETQSYDMTSNSSTTTYTKVASDTQVTSDTQTGETLEEYLDDQICTACHKHCSLLSPQCGRGETQAQQAAAEYDELYAESSDDQSASSQTDSGTNIESDTQAEATLEEYLGNQICTACPKRCSLLSPQCGRGETQAQQAAAEYDELYGSSSDTESTSALVFTDEDGSIEAAFADFIPIMGMVICGTHYTLKFAKREAGKES